jgi:hypothetical protein
MKIESTAVRGAVAGAVAATAIAGWFLIIDILGSQPFRTPAFLAATLLGLPESAPSGTLIAVYTVVHYAVLIAFGMAVAWLFAWQQIRPGLLLGLVAGFLLFDVLFYGGLIMTGIDVVRYVGWPQVLIGAMLAGVALTATLAATGDEPAVAWHEVLAEHRVVREALVSAGLGALVVALWFFVVDLAQGRLFFTPAALGSAVLFGARSVEEVQITMATVLGYTGVHVAGFLIVGFIAAALAEASERQPVVLLGVVLLFVTFQTLFLGLLAILATWLVDTLAWWTILAANLLAAVVVGGYLLREHPRLRAELSRDLEEELT